MGNRMWNAVKPMGDCGIPARPRGRFAAMLAHQSANYGAVITTAVRPRGFWERGSG